MGEISAVRHEFLAGEVYGWPAVDCAPRARRSPVFEHYRQIPSSRAVVYVCQDRNQIEVRTRNEGRQRGTVSARNGAVARLASFAGAVELDVDAVYTVVGV